MITLYEAIEIINNIDIRLPEEEVKLTDAWNRVLREKILSDMNMPPFNKSAMDGFACRKADLEKPLKVMGTLHAGSTENYTITPGTCIKIMTGAPVPAGADTVIMMEHTRQIDGDYIQFTRTNSKSNICLMGEDVHTGDLLLEPGTLLLPYRLAILASAGVDPVTVSKLPQVALVSTGSELVEPGQIPSTSQIRNSNAYNLLGQLKTMGISAHYDGIAEDSKEIIRSRLLTLFKHHDVVVITGGASQGDHDYIPAILNELQMDVKYNKLAIQPGKPISFAAGKGKFCFGLSGNPVSSYLQFELLVKPFLYHMMAHDYQHPIIQSELVHRIQRKNPDRLKFFPVRLNAEGRAEEIRFNGSAHIAGLHNAHGFGLFPKDCEKIEAGEKIELLLIR
jgi:molybdopterin molybdotransferase